MLSRLRCQGGRRWTKRITWLESTYTKRCWRSWSQCERSGAAVGVSPVRHNGLRTAEFIHIAKRARCTGSRDGIHGAILETGMVGAGRTVSALVLAQARSNRGPRGRKTDFRDAKRSVSRLLSNELILRYVPGAEQRCWRTLTRTKYQLTQDRVRLQDQLKSLLEDCQIKLSSVVSGLLGASGQRILRALAGGETDPTRLRQLGKLEHGAYATCRRVVLGLR